ncbi:hypothetical protein V8U11_08240 [Pseudomonas chlororaphis]|uniref:hypothetical protein n=1 Tax=Pseudomonas chlororaphis TaxID=587753 RepID=UPI0030D1FB95
MATKGNNRRRRTLLFPVGALVLSPGIDRLMRDGHLDPLPFLRRHVRGDWGDVTDERWQTNNAAVESGGLLESLYIVHRELSIRIVTDADHSQTRVTVTSER